MQAFGKPLYNRDHPEETTLRMVLLEGLLRASVVDGVKAESESGMAGELKGLFIAANK